METAAGIVLAGGRSARMGAAKADLEWHGSTLLHRTAAILARDLDPVVVVAAPGQVLPELPAGVVVVHDPVADEGPVRGLATGLAAVDTATAFVCSTDLPFLHPAYVRRVLRELTDDVDVVLPIAHGHRQPLAAAYRTALAPAIAELLAGGNRKLGLVLDHFRVRRLDEAELLADPELSRVDPTLESVTNVNTPADYAEAQRRPAPEVAPGVHAATVAAVPGAVTLNGLVIPRDGRTPLVTGDTITFS